MIPPGRGGVPPDRLSAEIRVITPTVLASLRSNQPDLLAFHLIPFRRRPASCTVRDTPPLTTDAKPCFVDFM